MIIVYFSHAGLKRQCSSSNLSTKRLSFFFLWLIFINLTFSKKNSNSRISHSTLWITLSLKETKSTFTIFRLIFTTHGTFYWLSSLNILVNHRPYWLTYSLACRDQAWTKPHITAAIYLLLLLKLEHISVCVSVYWTVWL